MKKILCISDCCCDVIFGNLEKIPVLGREEYCKEFSVKTGGGSNTAVALSRLGIDCSYLSTIGKDDMGNLLYDMLGKTGINLSDIKRECLDEGKKLSTAVSAVLSTNEDRCFVSWFKSGISECFTKDDIRRSVKNTHHIHTYLDYCTHYPIADYAEEYGCSLSLDTGWNEHLRLSHVEHILNKCNIFKLNEMEAIQLTEADNVETALDILSCYSDTVIITLGKEGLIAKFKDEAYKLSAFETDFKDATGAGDLFFAGYLYGYAKGESFKNSLNFGLASSALAVSFLGGMDDRYTLENLLSYIGTGKQTL